MAQAQPLSFTNQRGERLAATLVDTGSPDIVILCHGYLATRDGFVFPALAEALAARGKSSLRFDFAGNGDSEGPLGFGNYLREVQDLRAAVSFCRDELKKAVAAVVGHSKGGNVVLLYGARYDDVPYIVNVAGRGVMARGIKERFGADILERLERQGPVEVRARADGGRKTVAYMLTKEAVDERMAMDMFAEVAKIGARVLTVHGSADTVIPLEDAHSLGRHIRQHSLAVVEGADHNFRNPDLAQELIRRVVAFLVDEV